jgi:hypothetical protein
MRIAILLLVTLFGIGGCATLREQFGGDSAEQKQRDAALLESSAQLICDNHSRRLWVKERDDAELLTITAIDTVSTHSYWRGLFAHTAYVEMAVLTPGVHTVQVQYEDAIFYGNGELTLDASAGKTYKLQKRVLSLGVQFWIEDAQGQRVTTVDDSTLQRADKS